MFESLQGVKERVSRDKRWLTAFTVVVSGLSLLGFNSEQRQVVLPLLVITNVGVFMLASLWGKGVKEPVPLFEIGTVYCAVLLVYSLVPFINYLLAGMTWGSLSDRRLLDYSGSPGEVGHFAWNYVAYFSSFAVTYLWLRDKRAGQQRVTIISDRPSLLIIALPLSALVIYFYLLNAIWGVDAAPSYAKLSASMRNLARLPLFFAQVSSHLRGILLIFKLAALILLFGWWKSKPWRVLLCLWLSIETLYMIVNMGPRFEAALLLLSALLCYHRLVAPVKLSRAFIFAALFLAGFQLAGMARSYTLRGDTPLPRITFYSLASATSEFQSSYATAYDLDQMKKRGQLENIPVQLYVSDFLMPVPQQLLPFKKIDPSEWYLGVRGFKDQTAYVFGVIAQSVIGFGLLELVLRGAVIGILFAWAQRWYTRHSSSFLPTLAYLWLCVWSYYTFRASTFYLLSPIIYRLLPALLFIFFGERLLRYLRRAPDYGRSAL
jgi:hypothetical protein